MSESELVKVATEIAEIDSRKQEAVHRITADKITVSECDDELSPLVKKMEQLIKMVGIIPSNLPKLILKKKRQVGIVKLAEKNLGKTVAKQWNTPIREKALNHLISLDWFDAPSTIKYFEIAGYKKTTALQLYYAYTVYLKHKGWTKNTLGQWVKPPA